MLGLLREGRSLSQSGLSWGGTGICLCCTQAIEEEGCLELEGLKWAQWAPSLHAPACSGQKQSQLALNKLSVVSRAGKAGR